MSAAGGSSGGASAAAAASASSAAPAAAPAAPARPGTVLIAGSVAHSLTGRKSAPAAGGDGVGEHNLYRFQRFAPLAGRGIVQLVSGATACHFFALDAAGALYAWGRNERGQLGLGDTRNRYVPALVPGLPPVLAIAAGKAHSLVVCQGGDVYAAGDNSRGQCGLGKGVESAGGMYPRFTRCAGLPAGAAAPSVAAGAEFSLALAGGAVYAAGSQEYGQCGNGTTGEYIVHAGKSAFRESLAFAPVSGAAVAGVVFTAVAAGANHGVALSREGVPYTWGFGGYGRLGHGTAADVLVPTPIKYFEANERLRIASIATGNAITFFQLRVNGSLYHVGISKKSGEATMRPTIFSDLAGVKVTGVAAGATSILVATGELQTVAFGPSPTYGEMGFGEEQKSSVKPKYVEDLTGLPVLGVAMGLGCGLVLVDGEGAGAEGEAARAVLAKLGAYDPKDPQGGAGGAGAAASSGSSGGEGGAKRKAGGGGGGGGAAAASKKAKK